MRSVERVLWVGLVIVVGLLGIAIGLDAGTDVGGGIYLEEVRNLCEGSHKLYFNDTQYYCAPTITV